MNRVTNHIYTNDEFIKRAERHEKSNAQIKKDRIKDIEKEELRGRCRLSSKSYKLAGKEK